MVVLAGVGEDIHGGEDNQLAVLAEGVRIIQVVVLAWGGEVHQVVVLCEGGELGR